MEKTYRIEIGGMGCAHCVRGVTEALTEAGASVQSCEIGRADVKFDGETEALRGASEARGFEIIAITEG